MPYSELSGGNGEISFTGQNKDTTWLQYDFLARQYDPNQGRWLMPDPAGIAAVDPTNPQSWNRYAYVGNSPLNMTDPLGLEAPCTRAGDGIPCFQKSVTACDGLGIIQIAGFTACAGPGNYLATMMKIIEGISSQNAQAQMGSGNSGSSTTANNDPSTGVPANPCASAGSAPNPNVYATAGKVTRVVQFLSPKGFLLTGAYLLSFQRGGPLDAQPLGASRAYGNYVYGASLSASGIPLPIALAGANAYAAASNAQYPGFTMDPHYPALPQANVANITNGYNAQQNGTLCHK